MNARHQFEIVDDEPTPEPEQAEPAGTSILLLALKALSQRAIAAVADLFFLTTVGLTFWLWYQVPDPNAYQITSLALFGLFILAANWIVRRRL